MLRLSLVMLSTIALAAGVHRPQVSGDRPAARDTVQAGDAVLDAARLKPQRHRFVDRVLVWEPGVSIMYARE